MGTGLFHRGGFRGAVGESSQSNLELVQAARTDSELFGESGRRGGDGAGSTGVSQVCYWGQRSPSNPRMRERCSLITQRGGDSGLRLLALVEMPR